MYNHVSTAIRCQHDPPGPMCHSLEFHESMCSKGLDKRVQTKRLFIALGYKTKFSWTQIFKLKKGLPR